MHRLKRVSICYRLFFNPKKIYRWISFAWTIIKLNFSKNTKNYGKHKRFLCFLTKKKVQNGNWRICTFWLFLAMIRNSVQICELISLFWTFKAAKIRKEFKNHKNCGKFCQEQIFFQQLWGNKWYITLSLIFAQIL